MNDDYVNHPTLGVKRYEWTKPETDQRAKEMDGMEWRNGRSEGGMEESGRKLN